MSETVPGARGTELPVEADWDAVFIEGEWRDVEHRQRIKDVNPATGETFARVLKCTDVEVDAAYEAAVAAQEDWWNTRPQERTRIVRGVADLLDEHADEVRELANDTESGLAGSVHSADVGRARDVADRIGVGMMHVNDPPVNAGAHTPFGGMKASGIGRYNGDWIIREFTKGKWPSIQRHDRGYLF